MAKPVIAAQMFTVRDFCASIPDIAKSLAKVKDIGYTAVQPSGKGFAEADPKELAKVYEDSGLIVGATHISWDRFSNDLDAVIEEHKMWKCEYPAIGGVPASYREPGGAQRLADEIAPVAEKLAAAGMRFSYHNHNQEFARFDEKVWLEELFDRTTADQLCFEIDTYWVQAGGACPAAWIRKCAGRCPVVHFKDMRIEPPREQKFAPIGEGNLDWPGILAACEEAGARYAFVEQDQCYGKDPFEALAISYRNLKAMGLG